MRQTTLNTRFWKLVLLLPLLVLVGCGGGSDDDESAKQNPFDGNDPRQEELARLHNDILAASQQEVENVKEDPENSALNQALLMNFVMRLTTADQGRAANNPAIMNHFARLIALHVRQAASHAAAHFPVTTQAALAARYLTSFDQLASSNPSLFSSVQRPTNPFQATSPTLAGATGPFPLNNRGLASTSLSNPGNSLGLVPIPGILPGGQVLQFQ